ncbi:MAG: [Fe-Fe] hydrogenase large subunit C-terminal domain-containing protein, partial [Negativicutes bacterium]|nr:[Fe-Fe] hydrogenase large subunit C-terminal domain-containing protein [Negativicutes bacterium]
VKVHHCEGLRNCKSALIQINAEKLAVNFFEGMACEGGCIGGPGTLTNSKITSKLVGIFAGASKATVAVENETAAAEIAEDRHWHRK